MNNFLKLAFLVYVFESYNVSVISVGADIKPTLKAYIKISIIREKRAS